MKKQTLSTEEVRHVADLAKLSLKKVEVEKFRNQLSKIFEYVNQIGEMKTVGVGETSQVTGIRNKFREDKIDKGRMLTQEQALSNTKRKHNGYFVVKAVFD